MDRLALEIRTDRYMINQFLRDMSSTHRSHQYTIIKSLKSSYRHQTHLDEQEADRVQEEMMRAELQSKDGYGIDTDHEVFQTACSDDEVILVNLPIVNEGEIIHDTVAIHRDEAHDADNEFAFKMVLPPSGSCPVYRYVHLWCACPMIMKVICSC